MKRIYTTFFIVFSFLAGAMLSRNIDFSIEYLHSILKFMVLTTIVYGLIISCKLIFMYYKKRQRVRRTIKDDIRDRLKKLEVEKISPHLIKYKSIGGHDLTIDTSGAVNKLGLTPGEVIQIPLLGPYLYIGVGLNVNQVKESWFIGEKENGICCMPDNLKQEIKLGKFKKL